MAPRPRRPRLGAGWRRQPGRRLIGSTPLAAGEAARRILDAVAVQPPLRVPLDDALGAVLAEPVTSPIDLPAHTNSAMDGYAARSEDVRGATPEAPVVLTVVEQIPAGRLPSLTIGAGECARIFTGAPLPEGADCVVRQEDTDQGAARVAIRSDRDAGANVRQAGEDLRRGAQVVDAGTPLGPAHLGVLASIAVAHPLVHRRPRVAILGSGDEIVDLDQPDEILSGRRVASSNTHALIALVREAGGVPVNLGIARDRLESVREHLARARDCDLLVTTAGISVGEHDVLRTAVQEAGAIHFWRLRMRPGAPVGFGEVHGIPWIGLPGNPVSTMVTFELFVRPAIRKMLGHALPFRAATTVRTAEPIRVNPGLQHFLRGEVAKPPWPSRREEPIPVVRLTGPQGSGILISMVRAHALLIVPEGQAETPEGAELSALFLDDPRHQAQPPF